MSLKEKRNKKTLTVTDIQTTDTSLSELSQLIIEIVKTFVDQNDDFALIDACLAQGADINHFENGMTALSVCACNHSMEEMMLVQIITKLLDSGADPLVEDENGNSPMKLMIKYYYPGIVDVVMQRKDQILLDEYLGKLQRDYAFMTPKTKVENYSDYRINFLEDEIVRLRMLINIFQIRFQFRSL